MFALKTIVLAFVAAASVSAAPVEEASLAKRASGSGPGTYYFQNGNPGNCGKYSKDSDYVVAVNNNQYNGGKNCGKKIKVTNTKNGKSITARIQDRCPSCGGDGGSGIDLSEAAFMALGNKDQGVLPLKWSF